MILAIDPGTTESAWLQMSEDGRVLYFGKCDNLNLNAILKDERIPQKVFIEMVASFGMPVGREVFETCVWIGRFQETCVRNRWSVTHVYRHDVKLHHCHSPKANDATIRQALIDRYGGKERAIGKKATPGPLYGIKADVWSALAIATMAYDQRKAQR